MILALETSTPWASVALAAPEGVVAEVCARLGRASEWVPGAIGRLMAEAGAGWEDLRAVAVSLGPGSLTGVRVGLALAKGLHLARGIPLVGVPSLDVLAANLLPLGRPVAAVLDAKRGMVYAACYRGGERTTPYLLDLPEAVRRRLPPEAVLVGDGWSVHPEAFRGMEVAPAYLSVPRAAVLAALAWGRVEEGRFLDPEAAVPLYLMGPPIRGMQGPASASEGEPRG